MSIPIPIWESSKENIIPVKRGEIID